MSTHTKGPWTVSPLDGRNIGPTTLLFTEGAVVPQLQSVAIVRERVGESDANARLIAAAPELLAVARAIVGALDDTTFDVFIGTPQALQRLIACRSAAVAAIAKAEGR